jgi:uncharacterized protein (TIGR02246 family)
MRFIVLGALLLAASCAHLGPGTSPALRGELSQATAAWVAAYNSRDPQRIAALYDPEAVLWGTTSATIRTSPAAIADYFKDARKRPEARVSIGEQHDRFHGDLRISSGTYTFTDVRDGQNISNPSRFSFVFRKRDDRWLILDHHSSRLPAP